MSRTFRTTLKAMTALVLTVSLVACGGNNTTGVTSKPEKTPSMQQPQQPVEVCDRMSGTYVETSGPVDPELYIAVGTPEAKRVCGAIVEACDMLRHRIVMTTMPLDERRYSRLLSLCKPTFRQAELRLNHRLSEADLPGNKLAIIMAEACEHDYVATRPSGDEKWEYFSVNAKDRRYLDLYAKAYRQRWYRSPTVAWPGDLVVAMNRSCPSSFPVVGRSG